MRRIGASILASLGAALLASCSGARAASAVVWTDVPELAIAVELFDSRPGDDKVELVWKGGLAEALRGANGRDGGACPALVIGRGLDIASVRDRLDTIDYLLGSGGVNRGEFYPELLERGVIAGRRILLPISFNLPAIVFLRGGAFGGGGFTLSLEEMSAPCAAFNATESGGYTRMGFSPRWNGRFLVAALDSGVAGSKAAAFRERAASGAAGGAEPGLDWDEQGLAASLAALASWSARVNGPAPLEDDFQFKYLYAPPYRWIEGGKALYACMDSSELFSLPEKKRADLDFRWYASGGRAPVSEASAYAGLVRGAPGRKKAEAFLRWLLTPAAQRAILERSSRERELESSFGIAGGFSSIRVINEESLPAYYPALVGHAPPELSTSLPKPPDWRELEAAVVAPWALEAAAALQAPKAGASAFDPTKELAERIAGYREKTSSQR
jgi:hypothetical protein